MTRYFSRTAIALTAGALTLGTPALAANNVNARQAAQQHRIQQGVASGKLNAREAARLERQQGNIASYEARSRADDGHLDAVERARLARMQKSANKRIYTQKHDAQVK